MNRLTFSERIMDVIIVVIMLVLIVVTLYPLLYVVFASISDPTSLLAHSGVLWRPLGFQLDAYRRVLADPSIISGYANTLFIVVVGVLFSLLFTSLAAYVLSRKNVLWNKFFMAVIVIALIFNGGLIPFYLTVKGVGLVDSLWSVILPFTITIINLIIMKTSFEQIPDSLEESAKMDGAGHMTILFRIVLPLSKPIIAVMVLYYAVEKWNAWFYASIFIQTHSKFPLQLVLRQILLANQTDSMSGQATGDAYMLQETIKYAAIMVATLPILVVFPFLQKYFAKGALVGSVKG